MKNVQFLRLIFTFLILVLSITSYSQEETRVIYYKDFEKGKTTKKKRNAKYIELIKVLEESGLKTIEFRKISDNQLFEYKEYKDNIPVGIWKRYSKFRGGIFEYNYDFEVIYSDEKVENGIYYDFRSKKTKTALSGKYEPPKLISKEKDFINCYYMNIAYPPHARENGIEGKVEIQIKISKKGELEIISIYKGMETHLDKESVRAIKECSYWEPAKLDGVEVDTYSIVDVNFLLR